MTRKNISLARAFTWYGLSERQAGGTSGHAAYIESGDEGIRGRHLKRGKTNHGFDSKLPNLLDRSRCSLLEAYAMYLCSVQYVISLPSLMPHRCKGCGPLLWWTSSN